MILKHNQFELEFKYEITSIQTAEVKLKNDKIQRKRKTLTNPVSVELKSSRLQKPLKKNNWNKPKANW